MKSNRQKVGNGGEMEGIVPEEDPQREHDWWSGGFREKQIISWLVMIHFLI